MWLFSVEIVSFIILIDLSPFIVLFSSTHNTHIERIWVEVAMQFSCHWGAFFSRLENSHHLDHLNPHHLWLLHILFLDVKN